MRGGEASLDWVLLSVGPDLRSLMLHCEEFVGLDNEPRVSLNESPTQIRIELTELNPSPAEDDPRAGAAADRVEIHLSSRIDGRRIVGPGRMLDDGERHSLVYRTTLDGAAQPKAVPRVLDLAPEDARWVLLAQGLEPQLVGNGRRVLQQNPAPDAVLPEAYAPDAAVVRIRVGG